MRSIPWSDAQIRTLKRMRSRGSSTAEIAAVLTRSRSSVGIKIRRLDAPPRLVRRPPASCMACDDLDARRAPKDTAGCEALLSALRQHHTPGIGEHVIRSGTPVIVRRDTGSFMTSAAALCAEA